MLIMSSVFDRDTPLPTADETIIALFGARNESAITERSKVSSLPLYCGAGNPRGRIGL